MTQVRNQTRTWHRFSYLETSIYVRPDGRRRIGPHKQSVSFMAYLDETEPGRPVHRLAEVSLVEPETLRIGLTIYQGLSIAGTQFQK